MVINGKKSIEYLEKDELAKLEAIKLNAYPTKKPPKIDDIFTEKGYTLRNGYSIKAVCMEGYKYNLVVYYHNGVITFYSIAEVQSEIWKSSKLPKNVKIALSYIKRKLEGSRKYQVKRFYELSKAVKKYHRGTLIKIKYGYKYNPETKRREKIVKDIERTHLVFCYRRRREVPLSVCEDCKCLLHFTKFKQPICRIF